MAPVGKAGALTVLLWGVPLLMLVMALVPVPWEAPPPRMELVGLAAGMALLLFVAPRRLGYVLSPTELIIRRLIGATRLPLTALTARTSGGRLGIRLFGTGLPGYLTGAFSFGPGGPSQVQAAASRPDDGVIVEHAGRAYFLTPADPDTFLAELEAHGATVTR